MAEYRRSGFMVGHCVWPPMCNATKIVLLTIAVTAGPVHNAELS